MPASSPATAPVTAPADALRIVLFGLPNAGKSSLLGALGQAGRTQEHLLDGKLSDPSHALEEQTRRLYEEQPRRTAEEVVPYTVQYRPSDGKLQVAEVIDCDGRVANDILASRRPPGDGGPRGALAREILRADTLVLVVDASAPPAQVEADFAEFGRFLRLFQEGRGRRSEVGGLPVFLVLTKCDLLAGPGDSTADWVERIEAKKREVGTKFREFLARGGEAAPFGRVDLHLWDTAVKRPALKNVPPRPREPYHVAELFRQAFHLAADFRARARGAQRRLAWTAGGAGGLVGLLLALVAVLYQLGGSPASELQRRAEDLLFTADRPSAAERLRGPESALRDRLGALAELQTEPGFDELPAGLRERVAARHDELRDYLAYLDRLRREPSPADAVRVEAVQRIADDLTKKLALPHEDWDATEAGRLRRERLEEADALLDAAGRVRDWYLDRADRARDLRDFTRHRGTADATGIDWRGWLADVEALLDGARRPPFGENEPLPGAPSLSYGAALRLDRVVEARAEWEARRQQLVRVLDLAAALGLAGPVKDRPPVLLIPRVGFTLAAARDRLRELQAAYPGYAREFTRADLPEALLPELTRAARTSYAYLLEPARAEVLRRLRAGGGGEETAAGWQAVRSWLAMPEELAAWRTLALTLARLADPDARDPVTALADFLQRSSFPITLRSLTLEIPDALGVRLPLGAEFAVYHPPTRADGPALVLALEGDGRRNAQERTTRYEFLRKEGGELTYRPGDALRAELPLRDGLVLTWSQGASTRYQFDRLHHAPRLHKAGQDAAEGKVAEGVRLTTRPAGGVPAVPDLMPVAGPR